MSQELCQATIVDHKSPCARSTVQQRRHPHFDSIAIGGDTATSDRQRIDFDPSTTPYVSLPEQDVSSASLPFFDMLGSRNAYRTWSSVEGSLTE